MSEAFSYIKKTLVAGATLAAGGALLFVRDRWQGEQNKAVDTQDPARASTGQVADDSEIKADEIGVTPSDAKAAAGGAAAEHFQNTPPPTTERQNNQEITQQAVYEVITQQIGSNGLVVVEKTSYEIAQFYIANLDAVFDRSAAPHNGDRFRVVRGQWTRNTDAEDGWVTNIEGATVDNAEVLSVVGYSASLNQPDEVNELMWNWGQGEGLGTSAGLDSLLGWIVLSEDPFSPEPEEARTVVSFNFSAGDMTRVLVDESAPVGDKKFVTTVFLTKAELLALEGGWEYYQSFEGLFRQRQIYRDVKTYNLGTIHSEVVEDAPIIRGRLLKVQDVFPVIPVYIQVTKDATGNLVFTPVPLVIVGEENSTAYLSVEVITTHKDASIGFSEPEKFFGPPVNTLSDWSETNGNRVRKNRAVNQDKIHHPEFTPRRGGQDRVNGVIRSGMLAGKQQTSSEWQQTRWRNNVARRR